jgi:tRNA modification GTPase
MNNLSTYFSGLNETIAAVSTAPGIGGIGIVRISGPDAFKFGKRIFNPARASADFQPRARRMYLGEARDPETGDAIDEVLWVFFEAPNSFTTQDMVEIHCHGGSYSTNRILEAAISAGCRLAEAGEFSCRAVLGGRLEISQAEAVCQLIEAKTGTESKAALQRLKNRGRQRN